MMDHDKLITVEDITVKYDRITALKHIQFDIFRGDFIAVVGVNGSGKTTLAKSILNLLRIHEGRVVWHNGTKIGYLPQHAGLEDRHFPATVFEVVSSGLLKDKAFPKWLNKADRNIIFDMLRLFDIETLADKRIGSLSGGQQQRALLARSMVMNPDILILDEPTNALDQESRGRFMQLLKSLNLENKLTIMMITHDVASVESYANRILYLEKHLLFDGSFEKFCETQPFSPYIHTHPKRFDKKGETS